MCLSRAYLFCRIHYYAQAHINMPYFLPNCVQMNFRLLGNSAVPDACQHVEVTQTKEAVESAGNFLFFFLDAMGPAVSLRLLCEGDTADFPHLAVPCIRCSS